jgi:hypothetical protein
MQCTDAYRLMARALDGDEASGLDTHVASCPQCAAEWSRLRAVESLFAAQSLVDPPPGFEVRVVEHIDLHTRLRPPLERSLLQIGTIISGTLVAFFGLLGLVRGGMQAYSFPPLDGLVAAFTHVGRTAQGVVAAHLGAVEGGALAWPLYCALSAAIALLWFGALVLPRYHSQAMRTRA